MFSRAPLSLLSLLFFPFFLLLLVPSFYIFLHAMYTPSFDVRSSLPVVSFAASKSANTRAKMAKTVRCKISAGSQTKLHATQTIQSNKIEMLQIR
jgi:hypothetical protein